MRAKFVRIIQDYFPHVFYLILVFLIFRIVEFTFIHFQKDQALSVELLISRSINFDVFFVISVSLLLLIPYMLISLVYQQAGKMFISTCCFLLILFNLLLTHFFLVNHSLLTNELFEFSFRDMLHIAGAEFAVNRISLLGFEALILFVSIYLFYIRKTLTSIRLRRLLSYAYLLLSVIVAFNYNHPVKSIKYFDTPFHYYAGNCKTSIFIQSILEKRKDDMTYGKMTIPAIKKALADWHSLNPDFHYSSDEYPFIHDDSLQDVLGNYFSTSGTKPNIVFIVSESLSSSFCGSRTSIKNLMPFMDSLIGKSLYWENFYSNAERSYGALTNILASLPYGDLPRGFINMKNEFADHAQYPKHTSIIEILKSNNYSTGFFYGGWSYYDNLNSFMKFHHTDIIIDQDNFEDAAISSNSKLGSHEKLVWGYNDKKLFEQSFLTLKKLESPYLSVYVTLSLHSPFNLCEKSYYEKLFLKNRLKKQGADESLLMKMDLPILASIFFVDDAMKDFFDIYSKRTDFKNTIFIITGDHSANLEPERMLENYHVPLIIYSPLLNRSAVFKGVSTHLDILPSLLALLQHKYSLDFPLTKHWIGKGLDTSSVFRSRTVAHLSLLSSTLPCFIVNNCLVVNKTLYEWNESGTKVRSQSDSVQNILELVETYKKLNFYSCKFDKILP